MSKHNFYDYMTLDHPQILMSLPFRDPSDHNVIIQKTNNKIYILIKLKTATYVVFSV